MYVQPNRKYEYDRWADKLGNGKTKNNRIRNLNKRCKNAHANGSEEAFCMGKFGYGQFCSTDSIGYIPDAVSVISYDNRAFAHLYENNGYVNHRTRWIEEDNACFLEIRVKGVFEGSTIDKYFSLYIDTFFVDKKMRAFAAPDGYENSAGKILGNNRCLKVFDRFST